MRGRTLSLTASEEKEAEKGKRGGRERKKALETTPCQLSLIHQDSRGLKQMGLKTMMSGSGRERCREEEEERGMRKACFHLFVSVSSFKVTKVASE